ADEAEIRGVIADSHHSLLPVADGSPDKALGVVQVGDVLPQPLEVKPLRLSDVMRKAPVVPDQLDAMDALRLLQQSGIGMAMVHDEYGHFAGVVPPADLLAAIVGHFVSHLDEGDEPMVIERDDGAPLGLGGVAAGAFAQALGG